jgi:hypothetical protein
VSDPTSTVLERLRACVERWSTSQGAPLGDPCEPGSGWLGLVPAVVPVLMDLRPTVLSWTKSPGWERAPVSLLSSCTLRWLHRHYPFAELRPEEQDELDRTYVGLLEGTRDALAAARGHEELGARVTDLVAGWQAALALLARSWVTPEQGRMRPTVSAEYSPELQLTILGLGLEGLAEPVLDLGCGERAELVRYLRARGKAAVGIDRYLSVEDGVRELDWFSLPLVPDSWGTVIAHQSFSLHFLHHHLGSGPEPERYARRYREILGAVRRGGAFVYAPGLPFLEPLLSDREFRVERRTVSGIPDEPALTARWLAVLGESPLYACRVERIGG